MKILVDMVHLADVNFYKNALNKLNQYHDVTITVVDRGNLVPIIRKEYPGFKVVKLGKHRTGKFGKILGLIDREIRFAMLFLKSKPDIVSSFGFYPGIMAKPFGIPAILFHDDYEYRFMFKMCKSFATIFHVPDFIRLKMSEELGDKFKIAGSTNSFQNIHFYNGFKETAYLKDFKPDEDCLARRGLEGKRFVFCRDISSVSLNYDQFEHVDLTATFEWLNERGYIVLYYPEKESNAYEGLCVKLSGAIPDILSLQYFASLTITSGDTIARESALLGTPVIYVGGRNMAVNQPLLDIGVIKETKDEQVIEQMMNEMIKESYKKEMRNRIRSSNWDDVTQLIVDALDLTQETKKEQLQNNYQNANKLNM